MCIDFAALKTMPNVFWRKTFDPDAVMDRRLRFAFTHCEQLYSPEGWFCSLLPGNHNCLVATFSFLQCLFGQYAKRSKESGFHSRFPSNGVIAGMVDWAKRFFGWEWLERGTKSMPNECCLELLRPYRCLEKVCDLLNIVARKLTLI